MNPSAQAGQQGSTAVFPGPHVGTGDGRGPVTEVPLGLDWAGPED